MGLSDVWNYKCSTSLISRVIWTNPKVKTTEKLMEGVLHTSHIITNFATFKLYGAIWQGVGLALTSTLFTFVLIFICPKYTRIKKSQDGRRQILTFTLRHLRCGCAATLHKLMTSSDALKKGPCTSCTMHQMFMIINMR